MDVSIFFDIYFSTHIDTSRHRKIYRHYWKENAIFIMGFYQYVRDTRGFGVHVLNKWRI